MVKSHRQFGGKRSGVDRYQRNRFEQLESREMLTGLSFEETSPLAIGQFAQLLSEPEATLAISYDGQLTRFTSRAAPVESVELPTISEPVREASLSPDRRNLTVMTSSSVVDYQLNDGSVVASQVIVTEMPDLVATRHVALDEQGFETSVFVATKDTISRFDFESGELTATVTSANIVGMEVLAGGRILYATKTDEGITVHDVSTSPDAEPLEFASFPGAEAVQIRVVRMDSDFDSDVLLVADTGAIEWHENSVEFPCCDGMWRFVARHVVAEAEEPPLGALTAFDLDVADADGNEIPDLLISETRTGENGKPSSSVEWVANVTETGFRSTEMLADDLLVDSQRIQARWADVDQDGRMDVIVNGQVASGEGTNGALRVFENTRLGPNIGYVLSEGEVDVELAEDAFLGQAQFVDLNSDGLRDVVIQVDDRLRIMARDGTTFRDLGTVGDALASFAIADMNSDGRPDLVGFAHGSSNAEPWRWWANLGNATFGEAVSMADRQIPTDVHPFGESAPIVPGDIDGDGDIDWAFAGAYENGPVMWLENQGDNVPFVRHEMSQTTKIDVIADYNQLHLADIDGDGDLDAVSAKGYSYFPAWHVRWYENRNGEFLETVVEVETEVSEATTFMLRNSEVVDYDLDGDLDIIGMGGRGVLWYENVDSTFTERHQLIGEPTNGIFDADGDGDYDFLGHAGTWFRNFGNDFDFQKEVQSELQAGDNDRPVLAVYPFDAEDDGDSDLFVVTNRRFNPKGFVWFENRSDQIQAGDANADGTVDTLDLDLICQAINTGHYIQGVDVNTDDALTIDDLVAATGGTLVIGDANFDGRFDSSDLTSVFQLGLYEDDDLNNTTWSSGDWNCDGEFNTSDLVAAFQAGAYVA